MHLLPLPPGGTLRSRAMEENFCRRCIASGHSLGLGGRGCDNLEGERGGRDAISLDLGERGRDAISLSLGEREWGCGNPGGGEGDGVLLSLRGRGCGNSGEGEEGGGVSGRGNPDEGRSGGKVGGRDTLKEGGAWGTERWEEFSGDGVPLTGAAKGGVPSPAPSSPTQYVFISPLP